jgi:hypothetical protein
MNGMQRRNFLQAGALAATFPAWRAGLARAGGTTANAVAEHVRAARAIGKPLLVLLVPEAQEGERMQLWSGLLALADDATLAELALCAVVCARTEDAARGARAAGATRPELAQDDVAVLIETDEASVRCVSGRDLPALAHAPFTPVDEDEGPYAASVRKRSAELAARVRAAVLPDGDASLARRAAAAEASLGMDLRMQLVLDLGPRPRLAHLDRGAAIVLAEARGAGDLAKEAYLARAALQRLWEEPPAGARWHSTTNYCPPCGMGHTPAIARHFLSFYAG